MLEGTVTRPIAGVERGHGLEHTFAGMGKDWLTMHSEIEKHTISGLTLAFCLLETSIANQRQKTRPSRRARMEQMQVAGPDGVNNNESSWNSSDTSYEISQGDQTLVKGDTVKLSSPQVLLGALLCCTFTCTTSRGNTAVPHQAVKIEVPTDQRIDRQALIKRHNITLNKSDPLTPLGVGNGEFAFTADITGLQTFPEYHQQGMALGTQSHWGWHSMPNRDNYRLADILDDYSVAGHKVPYASDRDYRRTYSPAATWLRANPHRLHLGQIGFRITKIDGSLAGIDDLANTLQTLDLWTGLLTSGFESQGQTVKVQTVCHPDRDILGIRIESSLLRDERLLVSVAFPYGKNDWGNAADWDHPDRHTTQHRIRHDGADLVRILDDDRYYVSIGWSPAGKLRAESQHRYYIFSQNGELIEIVFAFSPTEHAEPLADFETVLAAAEGHWRRFWTNGGAIDFSECTDPRAAELERRVVLSQYLTAIQCSGTCPPQETGLVRNSWYGKFHLEMHWWHAVHFALWDRLPLLERSLPWYESILPAFINEGIWGKTLEAKPDILMIQFGHNDSHAPGRPESTDAATDFRDYLRQYIDQARAAGGRPILVTPVQRRTYGSDGKLNNSLLPYADAMKAVAAEKRVDVIDLNASSGKLYEQLGAAANDVVANAPKDRTHFNEQGARMMSHLVMQELSKIEPILTKELAPAGPLARGKIASKPLFRDRVHDGAADPVLCWNRTEGKWFMFYTNRRANVPEISGVTWVHGTKIGIAVSSDGGATWKYRGTANINYGQGEYSYWAPEVVEHDGIYHMYLTFVPGVFADWSHPRDIIHLTSKDLLDWQYESTLKLSSNRVIDACVIRLSNGTWRMWYNNEVDRKSIYHADSPDLYKWRDGGKAMGERPGEGPKVFRWKNRYWMIVDVWQGLGVYYSDDCVTWTRQGKNLLEEPGKGPDDKVKEAILTWL